MPFSRFEHQSDSYDPAPELTPSEAEAFLNGVRTEETASSTRELDVRSISQTTIGKIQDALRSLQSLPERPTEQ